MKKTFHFLAGLPRSGSTVLSAILNQHPEVHASGTSGMGEVMFNTFQAWKNSSSEQASTDVNHIKRVLRGIMESRYEHIDKPIILDKARNWPEASTLAVLKELLPYQPKIIATVRDIDECAASFVRVAKPNNLEDFLLNSELIAHLKQSYQALLSGYELDKSCFLFVEYNDLLEDPKEQMERIHEFLGLSDFEYDYNHLDEYAPKEKDEEIWNIPNLHTIAPKLQKRHDEDPDDVLQHMHQTFVQPCFWREKPLTTEMIHPLDMQLAAGLVGDFEKGQKIAEELAIKEPKNHRAAFNRGWYELRKNNLQDGMKLLARGRIEKVFGNEKPKIPTEIWSGQSDVTVLLNLEGGLGDQIHGLRYVRELVKRNCEVIVACSGSLALLARTVPGVSAVVQHEAAFGVVHDYWLPSMSGSIPFEWEYRDIDGSPYILQPEVKKSDKLTIGVRWQGNPQFEHEQHRIFPPELLFNVLKKYKDDVNFISLQRDEGAELRPSYINRIDLSDWTSTSEAVASCDLVISSCTSVAHLSAAMGVPTWIAVPILPYYLWAKPGNTTEWYDSVRLFRQQAYGDWTHVFSNIEENLKREIENANKNRLLDSRKEREGRASLGLQAVG